MQGAPRRQANSGQERGPGGLRPTEAERRGPGTKARHINACDVGAAPVRLTFIGTAWRLRLPNGSEAVSLSCASVVEAEAPLPWAMCLLPTNSVEACLAWASRKLTCSARSSERQSRALFFGLRSAFNALLRLNSFRCRAPLPRAAAPESKGATGPRDSNDIAVGRQCARGWSPFRILSR